MASLSRFLKATSSLEASPRIPFLAYNRSYTPKSFSSKPSTDAGTSTSDVEVVKKGIDEGSAEFLLTFHTSGLTCNQWRKLKNLWFPGKTMFRPGGKNKEGSSSSKLPQSVGPTCAVYWPKDAPNILASWSSIDQELLSIHAMQHSDLMDHKDMQKAAELDDQEASLFNFYLPSSYLSFVCSPEEFTSKPKDPTTEDSKPESLEAVASA